ncbi:hypothetical protein PVAP13_4KG345188 [Panicum virgatum]|uniref:Uncharacterized protein n=1 Tax=Panicum virgatum TaxID=38727 RepID=A0A8T0TX25_PANVG|nr:hypothetical protein PVAP13_4KG345188 [Panicum virgatum]
MTAPSATRFRPNLFLSPVTQGHQRITLAAVSLPRLPTDGGKLAGPFSGDPSLLCTTLAPGTILLPARVSQLSAAAAAIEVPAPAPAYIVVGAVPLAATSLPPPPPPPPPLTPLQVDVTVVRAAAPATAPIPAPSLQGCSGRS